MRKELLAWWWRSDTYLARRKFYAKVQPLLGYFPTHLSMADLIKSADSETFKQLWTKYLSIKLQG